VQVRPRGAVARLNPDDDETPAAATGARQRDSSWCAARPNTGDEAAAMSALAGLDEPARRVSTAAEQATQGPRSRSRRPPTGSSRPPSARPAAVGGECSAVLGATGCAPAGPSISPESTSCRRCGSRAARSASSRCFVVVAGGASRFLPRLSAPAGGDRGAARARRTPATRGRTRPPGGRRTRRPTRARSPSRQSRATRACGSSSAAPTSTRWC